MITVKNVEDEYARERAWPCYMVCAVTECRLLCSVIDRQSTDINKRTDINRHTGRRFTVVADSSD